MDETIRSGFAEYRRLAIHPDAPDVQVSECRKAFYAGVYHLLTRLYPHGYADRERLMRAVEAESVQFNKDLQAGRV